jgi:hypothetical protein
MKPDQVITIFFCIASFSLPRAHKSSLYTLIGLLCLQVVLHRSLKILLRLSDTPNIPDWKDLAHSTYFDNFASPCLGPSQFISHNTMSATSKPEGYDYTPSLSQRALISVFSTLAPTAMNFARRTYTTSTLHPETKAHVAVVQQLTISIYRLETRMACSTT